MKSLVLNSSVTVTMAMNVHIHMKILKHYGQELKINFGENDQLTDKVRPGNFEKKLRNMIRKFSTIITTEQVMATSLF